MNETNPYAPPSDESSPAGKEKPKGGRYTARLAAGGALVLSGNGQLPAVCMKCGTHDGIVRRMKTFRWTPVWVRYLIFCAIGAILMFVTAKLATLEVPLCASCDRRWEVARKVSAGGVVAVVAAFLFLRYGEEEHTIGVVVLSVVAAAFLAVSFLYVKPRMLQVKRIDDTSITLKGVAPSAAQEIVDGSS